ncbi:MAG: hypothetical protein ACO395_07700 [Pontimonas sp.]
MTTPNVTEEFEQLRSLAGQAEAQDLPIPDQFAEETESGDSEIPPEAEEATEGDEGSDDGSADADSPESQPESSEESEADPLKEGEELTPREKKKLSKAQESWEKAEAKHKEALAAMEQANQRLAEISRKEQELQERTRQLEDPVPGTSAEDLAKLVPKWAEEGETKLVEQAINAILVKAKHQVSATTQQSEEQFQAAWEANKAAVVKANPELTNADSPLTKAAMDVLTGGFGEALRAHPQGVALAVEAAKLQIEAGRASGLSAEVERLKAENARLSKKLSVDGPSVSGAPTERKRGVDWKPGDAQSMEKAWDTLRAEARGLTIADLG